MVYHSGHSTLLSIQRSKYPVSSQPLSGCLELAAEAQLAVLMPQRSQVTGLSGDYQYHDIEGYSLWSPTSHGEHDPFFLLALILPQVAADARPNRSRSFFANKAAITDILLLKFPELKAETCYSSLKLGRVSRSSSLTRRPPPTSCLLNFRSQYQKLLSPRRSSGDYNFLPGARRGYHTSFPRSPRCLLLLFYFRPLPICKERLSEAHGTRSTCPRGRASRSSEFLVSGQCKCLFSRPPRARLKRSGVRYVCNAGYRTCYFGRGEAFVSWY